jgi:hypothetical protein
VVEKAVEWGTRLLGKTERVTFEEERRRRKNN